MTGTRAVLLAFAGAAIVLVAGTAFFVWSFLTAFAEPPPDAAEANAVNQVFDARKKTFEPIRGLDRVLPVGMRWSDAEAILVSSKFVCKASATGEICYREVRRGPCRDDRSIEVGLADRRLISSITATETPNCL